MLRRLCLSALCLVACGAPSKSETPPSAPDASMASSANASANPSASPATAEAQPAPSTANASSEDVDPDAALASAKKEGKPAFVVFCAKWVAACGELAHVLVDPGVKKTLDERFVLVRVDVSNEDDPKTKDRMKKYNVKALPFIAAFDRKGKEVGRDSGVLDSSRMAKLLEKAK